MKVVAAILFLAALVSARPQQNSVQNTVTNAAAAARAFITKYNSTSNELGEYSYEVETSDGFSKKESAITRGGFHGQKKFLSVIGRYSYIDPTGELVLVTYTADERGFHPTGTHIPRSAGVVTIPQIFHIPTNAIITLQGANIG